MGEWKKYRLADVVSLVIDHRGKTPKKLGGDWAETGYRALSAKSVKTRQIVNEDAIRCVDEEMYRRWMKDEIQRGDILVTSEAPYGEVYYWNSDEKIVLSQRLFGLRVKPEFDSAFIAHYMTSQVFKSEMDGRATGTTVFGLRQPELLDCKLLVPDLPTQRRIAAVLGALDDKIEVNRKICENLEAQAQALFKAWFVDFEPFGGKRPEGWKMGKLGDIVDGMMNGDWGKDSPDEKNGSPVYCIRGADIPDVIRGRKGKMPLRYILPKNFAAKKLAHGNIVIEISGGSPTQSTGRSALITDSLLSRYERGMVCTNFCKAIRPRPGYSYFLYFWWRYLYDQDVFFQYENGTTGIKNLDISTVLAERQVAIPSTDILMRFSSLIEAHISAISQRGEETETLAAMRDALLPKLMSGELSVEKVEG